MKSVIKISLIVAMLGCMVAPAYAANGSQTPTAQAAPPTTKITTTPTGYTSADEVQYKTSGDYIANWGARGEDCVFLSTYAQSFYTGSYTYDVLSDKTGGTTQTNAKDSALYSSLQSMMTAKSKRTTNYDDIRYEFCYTDCVSNDTSKVSLIYLGTLVNSKWDQGKTYNREHTWPESKCILGRSKDAGDIHMVRPSNPKENEARGNKAYGTASDCYDPGVSTRGDCARIMLYVYTRWGNTQYMWGTSGVMESVNILLQWMEEDPVDTWEMGRNDAAEKITGTRNVFIDYPEYAWLMFGREIPDDMTTPSGIAKNGVQGGGTTTPDPDPTPETPAPTKDSGCAGALTTSLASVALGLACAFALGKRKRD